MTASETAVTTSATASSAVISVAKERAYSRAGPLSSGSYTGAPSVATSDGNTKAGSEPGGYSIRTSR